MNTSGGALSRIPNLIFIVVFSGFIGVTGSHASERSTNALPVPADPQIFLTTSGREIKLAQNSTRSLSCAQIRRRGLRLPRRCRSTRRKSKIKRYHYRRPKPRPTWRRNKAVAAPVPKSKLKHAEIPRTIGQSVVVPTRIYARPGEYPPENFKAYGILAFPALATEGSRERHLMICKAYRAVLPPAESVDAPVSAQMVTVWPLDKVNDDIWFEINRGAKACELAVDHYGLVLSQIAIRHARAAGMKANGAGPYLLAWAPPSQKGEPQAVVLALDLSNVTLPSQATEILLRWAREIEADPSLWEEGWSVDNLRSAMRHWVDKYGDKLVSIVSK